ncbi:hypothetical protein KKF81_00095 [Candidatus Micrarchaeota archaeon]|nr:hypothetical protein [Candidatus Micrarchaeota archaeon]MBU1165317.1 hypothetical protein [Candidatus Micrarchaeota archaeon]MBU1887112.1 hypothetical protein [Candidatus Micrarchaeota archaeon]
MMTKTHLTLTKENLRKFPEGLTSELLAESFMMTKTHLTLTKENLRKFPEGLTSELLAESFMMIILMEHFQFSRVFSNFVFSTQNLLELSFKSSEFFLTSLVSTQDLHH